MRNAYLPQHLFEQLALGLNDAESFTVAVADILQHRRLTVPIVNGSMERYAEVLARLVFEELPLRERQARYLAGDEAWERWQLWYRQHWPRRKVTFVVLEGTLTALSIQGSHAITTVSGPVALLPSETHNPDAIESSQGGAA